MLRGIESFSTYGSIADLVKTASCQIGWMVANEGLLDFVSPAPNGQGQCLRLGNSQSSEVSGTLIGKLPSNENVWIYQVGLDFSSSAADTMANVKCFYYASPSTNDLQFQITFTRAGGVIQVYNSAGVLIETINNAFPVNQPFYFSLTLGISPTAGVATIIINNTTIYQASNLNTQSGTISYWNQLEFEIPAVSGTLLGGVKLSDVVLLDTGQGSGVIPTNIPTGPVYVTAYSPNSNGATLQMIPGTGLSNWQEVSSPQSNDGATYNIAEMSQTNPVEDLYGFQMASSPLNQCLGIRLKGEYQTVDSAGGTTTLAATISHKTYSDGQDDLISSEAFGLGLPYFFFDSISTIGPDGNNWNLSAINGSEFGVQLDENPDFQPVTPGTSLLSGTGTISSSSTTESFTAASGITFNFNLTETYAGWPLGTLYDDLSLFVGPSGGFGSGGIHIRCNQYSSDEPPNIKVEVLFDNTPTLVAGPGVGYVPCAGGSPGQTFNYQVQGYAVITSVQDVGGVYIAFGEVAVYTTGPGGLQLIGLWNDVSLGPATGPIITDANVFTTLIFGDSPAGPYLVVYAINNASVPSSPILHRSQLTLEVVSFSGNNYGQGGSDVIPVFPALAGVEFPVLKRYLFSNVVSTGADGGEARVGFSPFHCGSGNCLFPIFRTSKRMALPKMITTPYWGFASIVRVICFPFIMMTTLMTL